MGKNGDGATDDLTARIVIPIGDWIAQLLREEVEIDSVEDLVELVQKYSTADVASMAVASRHLGRSPADLLPQDKLMLKFGARAEVARLVTGHTNKQRISTRRGEREIELPALVGGVQTFPHVGDADSPDPEGEVDTFVPSVSEDAAQRATDYLLRRVPGHIRGRLEILAANGVPIGPVMEEFNRIVSELVAEF